jgi:hypothetical protein
VLDGGEWSASRTGRFTPGERTPGTQWIRGWMGRDFFLFAIASRPALGPTQPRIQRVTMALSPGVKRQGRKAGAEVKNEWHYASTLPYVFMAWNLSTLYVFMTSYLVKHGDNFILPFIMWVTNYNILYDPR